MSNKNASEDLSRWDKIGWDEMRAFISPRVWLYCCWKKLYFSLLTDYDYDATIIISAALINHNMFSKYLKTTKALT